MGQDGETLLPASTWFKFYFFRIIIMNINLNNESRLEWGWPTWNPPSHHLVDKEAWNFVLFKSIQREKWSANSICIFSLIWSHKFFYKINEKSFNITRSNEFPYLEDIEGKKSRKKNWVALFKYKQKYLCNFKLFIFYIYKRNKF